MADYHRCHGCGEAKSAASGTLSIAGAVLATSAFFTTMIPYASANSVRLLVFFAPGAAGMALWTLSESRLKRRYRDGVWSEEELAPIRALLSHPAMQGAAILLFVLAALLAVFCQYHASLIYITTLPMSAISSMKVALAPAKPRTGGLSDWKNFKPIQSDHWGEPVRHGDAYLPPL